MTVKLVLRQVQLLLNKISTTKWSQPRLAGVHGIQQSENFDRESGPITDLISKHNQIKPQAYQSASDIYETELSIHQMTHRRC